MQHMSGRRGRAAYEVTGNVLWLTRPARKRDRPRGTVLASLQQSVTRLVGEVARSERLRADIAAAIETRRYELYRSSVSTGERASSSTLAAAQRAHVGNLLKFLHAAAAADGGRRAEAREAPARLHPLARSIRELGASVDRARRLSQEVLTQCQRPDWRESLSPLGPPRR